MFKVKLQKDRFIVLLNNKIFLHQEFFFIKLVQEVSLYHYYFLFFLGILQRFGLSKSFLRS
jgi:hypothetical protein